MSLWALLGLGGRSRIRPPSTDADPQESCLHTLQTAPLARTKAPRLILCGTIDLEEGVSYLPWGTTRDALGLFGLFGMCERAEPQDTCHPVPRSGKHLQLRSQSGRGGLVCVGASGGRPYATCVAVLSLTNLRMRA